MTISQESILADTFNQILTILNTNAHTIDLDGGGTATLRQWSSGKYWTVAYPTIDVDSRDSYPMGIIHKPTLTETGAGLRLVDHTIRIEIEVLTLSAEQATKFADKVKDALEDAIDTFELAGLHRKSVTAMRSEVIFRPSSNLKVHSIVLPYEFEYSLVRA